MSRVANFGADLQSGRRSFDIVGRRRKWFAISIVLVLVSMIGLGVRGLTLGVEFDGGAVFDVRAQGVATSEVREVLEKNGVAEAEVQKIGGDRVRAETETLTPEEAEEIRTALSTEFGIPKEEITTQVVGPSWGSDVTGKAVQSLLIFLILLSIYLAIVFQWKLAVGSLVALLHDIAITIGIYAIVGFSVTPATVIGLLTILGYSLYDTVVVFDKVRENTADLSSNKQTYSTAANLAINQTLVRSLNTTLIALLPVAGLLFVGAGLLGAGVLKDLALVLFIGTAVGAYSSIFLAAPLVVALKEREPEMQALAKRVAQREAAHRKQEEGAAHEDGTIDLDKATVPPTPAIRENVAPGERVQPKRPPSRETRQKKGPQI
ncbi:MAG: protein translocase subunit SecF [Sporichthyaceae bacterium]